MDDLRSILHAALPSLAGLGFEILDDLVNCRGQACCADSLARRLGLRNRHHLSRLLADQGLPQIEELTAWIKTLTFLAEWEGTRVSLCRQALEAQKEPGTYYRTVQRATGMHWRDVRALGMGFVLARFVERCARRAAKEPLAGARWTRTARVTPSRSMA